MIEIFDVGAKNKSIRKIYFKYDYVSKYLTDCKFIQFMILDSSLWVYGFEKKIRIRRRKLKKI